MTGKAEFVVYQRKRGWYWRLVAPNGEILSVGAEPFDSAGNARRSIRRVRQYGVLATIVIVKS